MKTFGCHFSNYKSPEIDHQVHVNCNIGISPVYLALLPVSPSPCVLCKHGKWPNTFWRKCFGQKFSFASNALISIKWLRMRFTFPCNDSFRYLSFVHYIYQECKFENHWALEKSCDFPSGSKQSAVSSLQSNIRVNIFPCWARDFVKSL